MSKPPRSSGVRIVNLMRMFNFRHGLTKEVEAPSLRYGSTPVDGPAEGKGIREHWDAIRDNYYEQMGWDAATGQASARDAAEVRARLRYSRKRTAEVRRPVARRPKRGVSLPT